MARVDLNHVNAQLLLLFPLKAKVPLSSLINHSGCPRGLRIAIASQPSHAIHTLEGKRTSTKAKLLVQRIEGKHGHGNKTKQKGNGLQASFHCILETKS